MKLRDVDMASALMRVTCPAQEFCRGPVKPVHSYTGDSHSQFRSGYSIDPGVFSDLTLASPVRILKSL